MSTGTLHDKATGPDNAGHDAAPVAAPKQGPEVAEAQAMLQRGEHDPKKWGELLMLTRGPARDQIVIMLNQTLGNAFVQAAMRSWSEGPGDSSAGGAPSNASSSPGVGQAPAVADAKPTFKVNEQQAQFGDSKQVAAPEITRNELLGGGTAYAGADGGAGASAPRDESKVETDVIFASLQLAQLELEKGTEQLRGKEDTKDAATTKSTVEKANRHLGHAWTTIETAGGGLDKKRLQAQMDATSNAYIDLMEQVLMSSDDTISSGDLLKPLEASNTAVRSYLGMGVAPTTAKHKKVKGSENRLEGKAIGPVLELAELEAKKVFARLVKTSDQKDTIIEDELDPLASQLTQAAFLLKSHEGKDEAKSYGKQVEATSNAVLEIHSWLASRQANAEAMSGFSHVVGKTNEIRQEVGFGAISDMKAPQPVQGEQEESDQELLGILTAQTDFTDALDGAFHGFQVGADRFKDLASLKKPPPPPEQQSFFDELMKGMLISVLGNLAGPVMGAVVGKLAAEGAKEGSKGFIDFVQGTTVDSVEAIASKIADGAFANVPAPTSDNDDARSRRLFYEGLVISESEIKLACKKSVNDRVRSKSISTAELNDMTDQVYKAGARTQTEVADLTYRKAAHGYAQGTARKTTGTKGKGNDAVSNLDNYGGKLVKDEKGPWQDGHARSKTKIVDVKEGATGIGKLSVDLYDHGRDDGGFAGTEIKKFEMHGMNDDMAIAILQHADYSFDKLDLPLEIHVTPSWDYAGRPRKIMLVVDEAGKVNYSEGWPQIANGPIGRQGRKHSPADNSDLYKTPESLWEAIKNGKIPTDAATITKGG